MAILSGRLPVRAAIPARNSSAAASEPKSNRYWCFLPLVRHAPCSASVPLDSDHLNMRHFLRF